MNIKKIFDNIFNIMMDVQGKSKYNVNVILNLKEYYKRRELVLSQDNNQQIYEV